MRLESKNPFNVIDQVDSVLQEYSEQELLEALRKFCQYFPEASEVFPDDSSPFREGLDKEEDQHIHVVAQDLRRHLQLLVQLLKAPELTGFMASEYYSGEQYIAALQQITHQQLCELIRSSSILQSSTSLREDMTMFSKQLMVFFIYWLLEDPTVEADEDEDADAEQSDDDHTPYLKRDVNLPDILKEYKTGEEWGEE